MSIPLIKECNLQFSNKILGKGGFGIVRKGKYLGTDVAIKSLTIGKNLRLIYKEIKLLDKIRHPNIISIMTACESLSQFHIVMEFFDSHSLHSILFKEKFKLDTNLELNVMHQLACAISYLHLQPIPIIHRDIKPANTLINKYNVVKLCDLGLGKCNALSTGLQSTATEMQGTYVFMAPEIIIHCQEATTSSDI